MGTRACSFPLPPPPLLLLFLLLLLSFLFSGSSPHPVSYLPRACVNPYSREAPRHFVPSPGSPSLCTSRPCLGWSRALRVPPRARHCHARVPLTISPAVAGSCCVALIFFFHFLRSLADGWRGRSLRWGLRQPTHLLPAESTCPGNPRADLCRVSRSRYSQPFKQTLNSEREEKPLSDGGSCPRITS